MSQHFGTETKKMEFELILSALVHNALTTKPFRTQLKCQCNVSLLTANQNEIYIN